MRNIFSLLLLSVILTACGGKGKQKEQIEDKEQNAEIVSSASNTSIPFVGKVLNQKTLPKEIDLDQNIDNMSYQELRIWLHYVYAVHGLHIMEADLNSFFSTNTDWYEELVLALWEDDKMPEKYSDITLSEKEQSFVDKVNKRISELQKNNFVQQGKHQLGNIDNIVNLFQYQDMDEPFFEKLRKNNFTISRGDNIQLFHVYEENDYHQVPNFITTDLYLQAFHMYFSYTLKSLEQEKLIPILTKLCLEMYNKSKALTTSQDEKVRKLAEFNTTFYAIPYYLLTNKKLSLSEEQQKYFDIEIKNIQKETDVESKYLGWDYIPFGYSLFKPRGHYTRKEEMKQYFRAMMWLQTIPFCLDENEKFDQSIFSSTFLADTKIYNLYKSIYEPIAFLIGLPDNLSFMDIADFLKKQNWYRRLGRC